MASDNEIVKQVLAGKTEVFRELIVRYQRLVKTGIWNYFRSQNCVDDLCQEVFLKAFTKLGSLKNPEKCKNWLLQITFRVCVDFSRKDARTPLKFSEPNTLEKISASPGPGDSSSSDFSETLSLLEKASPLDGLILWLKYVENQSYADIGTLLEIAETTVRQKASRAVRLLRENMK